MMPLPNFEIDIVALGTLVVTLTGLLIKWVKVKLANRVERKRRQGRKTKRRNHKKKRK